MEERKYRNKAFLSYRHVEKDERIAALLQRRLEHYHVPGGIVGREASRGVGRIFRDQTDLGARADLTAELQQELKESEYMIVLCSKEAVESAWIAREIRYFLQFHPAEQILPVLIDGEPETVLPAIFGGMRGMPAHPLACDLRRKAGHSLRQELPRLVAALLSCRYDDLVNRRHRYEAGRLAALLSSAVLILTVLTAFFAVSSARIRRSLREQQKEESIRLASQSENALAQRRRIEAIRYAREALPEKEGDKDVIPQAVLALQRALGAYVPAGSSQMGQTAEFQAPGRILALDAAEVDGSAFLAVSYGQNEALLWNADTGDILYDSAVLEGRGAYTDEDGGERRLHLAQDIFLRTADSRLMGIDTRTGALRWEAEEEESLDLYILDSRDGIAAVDARGIGMIEALELRSTKDGALLLRRPVEQRPDPTHNVYLRGAAVVGLEKGVVFVEETSLIDEDIYSDEAADILEAGEDAAPVASESEDHDDLYVLDAATGKERLLLTATAIPDFRITEDGGLLALLYEGVRQESMGVALPYGVEQCYIDSGDGDFQVCRIDLITGDLVWKAETGCVQNYEINILPDLQIADEKVCALSAGTHVEIFSAETGQRLWAFDYPGVPAHLSMDLWNGQEVLAAVLQDGSQAAYSFSGGELLRKRAVFPNSITSVRKAGGKLFFLCAQNGLLAVEDRIYAFSGEVHDEEVSVIRDSSGQAVRADAGSFFANHGAIGAIGTSTAGWQKAVGDVFLLMEADGKARGVEARAGEIRWEAQLGENIALAGLTKDGGLAVFRDYVVDGKTAAIRAAQGLPATEETWQILHTGDGQVETVKRLLETIPDEGSKRCMSYTVGGNALVMLAAVGEEETPWLLRYSILEKKTDVLCLPEKTDVDIPRTNGYISMSPDGNCTACTFTDSVDPEAPKYVTLLADWETGRVTEAEGVPVNDGNSVMIWSEDGGSLAFLGTDRLPCAVSRDGRQLFLEDAPEGMAEGIGFLEGKLFIVEERDFSIHFRIPQDGVDILLPADRQVQFDQSDLVAEGLSCEELPGRKALLQYGSQIFAFSLATGDVEAVIDHVVTYNPQTDTFLLSDDANVLYTSRRYGWEDLAQKAEKAGVAE